MIIEHNVSNNRILCLLFSNKFMQYEIVPATVVDDSLLDENDAMTAARFVANPFKVSGADLSSSPT